MAKNYYAIKKNTNHIDRMADELREDNLVRSMHKDIGKDQKRMFRD